MYFSILIHPIQPAPATAPDPSLAPEVNAAIAAFNQKDYNTAWRNFMAAAQKGDSEGEAGMGAMLFNNINPPGTGYYAQCEKWPLASANQDNTKGMGFLGLMYEHVRGVNQDIPKAMDLFDRAAEKGQRYAQMEAKGMRMQGEANAQAARMHHGVEDSACETAGGIPSPGECLKGGGSIDPFNAEQAASPNGNNGE
ncbi:MAG: hypothetical protein LAO08_06790 [Acidobacteriia bacterium]|nr:hypothetical protein [Terriglobia bacterium]